MTRKRDALRRKARAARRPAPAPAAQLAWTAPLLLAAAAWLYAALT